MKYLLDTHALLWLLEGSPRLGAGARSALATESRAAVGIAAISLLEIAMLAARGVIVLEPSPAKGLSAIARQVTALPIDAAIAADAVEVPLPHRDPFDRVIVATARTHGLTLVTRDRQIVEAGVVPTLW